MTEHILAIALATMLLGGLTVGLSRSNDFSRIVAARDRCLAAARGQLDCISATGGPIRPEETERLWPGVTVEAVRSEGRGRWKGLDLVRVSARATAAGREQKIVLSRYVAKEPPE